MGKSTTRFTSFRRLEAAGNLATTMIRLMMACNDLSLADDSLAAWDREQSAGRKGREVGARMYFISLQIAHVFEALEIIGSIRASGELMEAVGVCDSRTRQSFEKVAAFVGTADYKRMLRIKNNITFHYDSGVIDKALPTAAKKHPDGSLAMSMGQASIDWHFEPADQLIDRIVVRDIFGVPEEANVREEVDKIVVRLQEIGGQLVEFAGYFIWHHVGR